MKITPVKLWRRQKHVASLIGKTGTLLQWTVIRVPAKTFVKEAPYPVAIVKMDNNEKMIGQLVDWQLSDLEKGKVPDEKVKQIAENVVEIIKKSYEGQLELLGLTESPLKGAKGGNVEYVLSAIKI